MSRKVVSIPGMHDLDISTILPLVDHPLLQKLRLRKQLGTAFLSFLGAGNNRLEHALATYSLILKRTEHWVLAGYITPEEGRNVALFGLLHDIGHGPYSHVTEPLCLENHNSRGLLLLDGLKPEIAAANGQFNLLKELFARCHPLFTAVSHHPLGADKLAYLACDTRYTNEAISLPLGALLNYVYFQNGTIVADSKIVEEVIQTQRNYYYMYSRVYCRKSCLITGRVLQKLVSLLVTTGELDRCRLGYLVDCQLDALFINSHNPAVKEGFEKLLKREFPRTAIAIYPAGCLAYENASGKPIRSLQVDPRQLDSVLSNLNTPEQLDHYEECIASLAGIPPADVALVRLDFSHRSPMPDIPILWDHGRIYSLEQIRPHHYASLRELINSHPPLRICVGEKHRAAVAARAGQFVECLLV